VPRRRSARPDLVRSRTRSRSATAAHEAGRP
jgi:hypothetical protein